MSRLSSAVVDGKWGKWGDYSDCSASCGDGKMQRKRACDNPSARGGAECSGNNVEISDCNNGPCTGGIVNDKNQITFLKIFYEI